MIIGVLLFALITSFIMHKLTKLDFSVCLMASTPGGLQEMSLLSDELGADTPKIAVMQTSRLMVCDCIISYNDRMSCRHHLITKMM